MHSLSNFPVTTCSDFPWDSLGRGASSVVWLAGYHIPRSSILRYLDWKIFITVLYPWVGFLLKFEHLSKEFSNSKLLLWCFVTLRFLGRDFRNSMQRGNPHWKKKKQNKTGKRIYFCLSYGMLWGSYLYSQTLYSTRIHGSLILRVKSYLQISLLLYNQPKHP